MNTQHPSISRRRFLAAAGAFSLTIPLRMSAQPQPGGPLRFGVITDVHQDVMHDGVERITAFVDAMRAEKVDFIAQLGDFCVPHERNRKFLEAWNRFEGPKYHVIGNHDTDGGFKSEQTVAYWGMPARHYGFDAGGVRFVVLDGNDPGGKGRGYKRFVAQPQLDWLAGELKATDRPVVVMIHQPLESVGGVENQEAVRAVLEASRAGGKPGVVACLTGHLHQDYVRTINGIAHAQFNSASYVWLSGKCEREVYPPELHKAHPYLRCVAPYRDPLWAVVTIDLAAATMTIQGRASEWVGPDPWARGADEKDYPRDIQRPAISNWAGKV